MECLLRPTLALLCLVDERALIEEARVALASTLTTVCCCLTATRSAPQCSGSRLRLPHALASPRFPMGGVLGASFYW
mgnify:CR=1 FL=1